MSPVVDYHGLGHRYLLRDRLLMRPQLNGGTLDGPQMGAERPHRLNVVGPFYVVDGCCTACGMPESEAPDLFAWDDSDHCFVRKQPSSPEELRQMISAIACADLRCIRYRGRDRDVMSSLKNIGEIEQCDHAGWTALGTASLVSSKHVVDDRDVQVAVRPVVPHIGPDRDDAAPLTADIPVKLPGKKPSSSSRHVARTFGGLLGFLSLWQLLSPVNRADTLLGFAGLATSTVWLLSRSNLLRVVATAALALGVAVRVVT